MGVKDVKDHVAESVWRLRANVSLDPSFKPELGKLLEALTPDEREDLLKDSLFREVFAWFIFVIRDESEKESEKESDKK